MLRDLLALLARAEVGHPGFRRQVLQRSLVYMAAEWLLVLSALAGLRAQRAGESTGPAFMAFGLGCFLIYWSFHHTNLLATIRFTEMARERVEAVCRRMHRLPLLEFERIGRGTLMTRLLGDGNRLARVGKPVLNLLIGCCQLVLTTVFVLAMSPTLAAVVVLVGIAAALIALEQRNTMARGFGDIARGEAEVLDNLRDQQGGAIGVRLHRGRRRGLRAHFRAVSDRLFRVREDIWSAYFERQFGYQALIYALLGVNVFLVPLVADVDNEAIRDTNLVVLMLFFALSNVVFALPTVGRGALAAERLDELAHELSEDSLEPADHAVGRGRLADFRALSVHGLTFSYPTPGGGSGFAVGPVDLTLKRGEVVYIVGHNGSGKSTFLRMLCGLYPADTGRITVDGETIARDDLPHLRALFGTIFVDHHLFERVVDGQDAETAARGRALIERLGIGGKTDLVDGRLTDTALSTGQKKRLAMVVAQLRDRPIMLFDEWAADQDPEFRLYYYQTLLPALRDAGKLVIVVSHDDQHFGLADRIVRLADGQIVADEVQPR